MSSTKRALWLCLSTLGLAGVVANAGLFMSTPSAALSLTSLAVLGTGVGLVSILKKHYDWTVRDTGLAFFPFALTWLAGAPALLLPHWSTASRLEPDVAVRWVHFSEGVAVAALLWLLGASFLLGRKAWIQLLLTPALAIVFFLMMHAVSCTLGAGCL